VGVYTNVRKQALDQAKAIEATASVVPIYQIGLRALKLPTLVSQPAERMATVNYSVPLQRLRKLAQELGSINMSYRDVGLKSFNYTFDDLVGKE
jgi:hypothetical protein